MSSIVTSSTLSAFSVLPWLRLSLTPSAHSSASAAAALSHLYYKFLPLDSGYSLLLTDFQRVWYRYSVGADFDVERRRFALHLHKSTKLTDLLRSLLSGEQGHQHSVNDVSDDRLLLFCKSDPGSFPFDWEFDCLVMPPSDAEQTGMSSTALLRSTVIAPLLEMSCFMAWRWWVARTDKVKDRPSDGAASKRRPRAQQPQANSTSADFVSSFSLSPSPASADSSPFSSALFSTLLSSDVSDQFRSPEFKHWKESFEPFSALGSLYAAIQDRQPLAPVAAAAAAAPRPTDVSSLFSASLSSSLSPDIEFPPDLPIASGSLPNGIASLPSDISVSQPQAQSHSNPPSQSSDPASVPVDQPFVEKPKKKQKTFR